MLRYAIALTVVFPCVLFSQTSSSSSQTQAQPQTQAPAAAASASSQAQPDQSSQQNPGTPAAGSSSQDAKPAPQPAPAPPSTAANSSSSPAAPPQPKAANVPPTAPVITLTNFCAAGSKNPPATKAPGCNRIITRAEFEQVVSAVIPKSRLAKGQEVPAQVKQAIAREYATILVMANAAQKRGFPAKDPATMEMLKLSRLQVLAQGLSQELQEKAKPTDAQSAKYYQDNASAFTEATLRRLIIPKPLPSNGKDKPADDAALKAAAQKLRDRAAAGEDFDKLQKEAYDASGNKQAPPPTQIGAQRRGTLPPDQDAQVFNLAPGGVSQLLENPGGWYVYKIESKRTLPLAEVKDEIVRKLQPERLADERNDIINSVSTKLNDQYFGPAESPGGMPGMRMPPQGRGQPNPSGPKSQKPPAGSAPQSQPPPPQ
jgi:parvulin-like peptidyl-prolyl isomerase